MRTWTTIACVCWLGCAERKPSMLLGETAPGREREIDRYVCADGSGEFREIQAAIDAAWSGQVIGVCPGTYGPIELLWGDDLVIVGLQGAEATTIDGGDRPAVHIDEGKVELIGLRFTGTGRQDPMFPKAGGISLYEGTAIVRDSVVEGCRGPFTLLFDEDYLELDNVVWRNNATDYLWYLWQGEDDAPVPGFAKIHHNLIDGGVHKTLIETTKVVDLQMSNNIFANTQIDSGYTAFIFEKIRGGTLSVTNNVFYNLDDLAADGGRLFVGEADFRNNIVVGSDAWDLQHFGASYSLFWDNGVDYAPYVHGEGNLFVDPMFANPEAFDFTLLPGSPAIDAGDPNPAFNDPDGTRNDMGRYGGPRRG